MTQQEILVSVISIKICDLYLVYTSILDSIQQIVILLHNNKSKVSAIMTMIFIIAV